MSDITSDRLAVVKTSVKWLSQFYLKREQLIEKLRPNQPPRVAVITNCSVRLFRHGEFKHDVAFLNQFYKAFNARLVAVNQFLVRVSRFGLGLLNLRFYEGGA